MRIELTEFLPRHAFLAPLIRGARVLELGALERNSGAAAAALRERGAASVLAVGSAAAVERARREQAGQQLDFRNAPLAQLPEAAFDLVIAHDPATVLADGGPAALKARLAAGGRLAVVVPAAGPSLLPRGEDDARYGAVLGALLPHFPSIEVATQQVLLGWLMSPAGCRPPRLSVDDRRAPGEAPAFHLLLCGTTPAGLEEQLLVPLQAPPILAAWGERGAGVVLDRERARAEGLVAELRAARERIAERESWIEGLRHEVEQRHETAELQAAELKAAQVKLGKLEREQGEASESLRRVREQMVARGREMEGARRAAEARTEDLRLVEAELEEVRDAAQAIQQERAAAASQLAAAQARLESLEAERKGAQARLESLEAERKGAQARIAAMTAALAEAQARTTALEAELAQARSAGAPTALHAVEQEEQRLLAEVEALRSMPPDIAAGRAREADDLPRRVRTLEDEVDAAARRLREAEERMRAAERRADEADAARAESVATARRWQLAAETMQREAAGVAAAMADREALRMERDEAIARAAEEAGRRAAARAQLQEQIDRANEAEAALRRALEASPNRFDEGQRR